MSQAPSAPPPPRTEAQKSDARKKSPRSTIPQAVSLNINSGPLDGMDRIVVYGPGSIGKSTLCAYLPSPLFIDIEGGTRKLNVSRDTAEDWEELRGKLSSIAISPPEGVKSVVIDTATVAETFATEHVINTRKAERSNKPDVYVDSIEKFGWGKGWQFVYDEFNGLLADLDRISAKGLYTCLIAHEVDSPVPNPAGEDYIRWEPHLYSGDKKGRGSIRARVKQWADHVLFIGYDVHVEKGTGKGTGSGTRTIYTQELPTHIAASRTELFSMAYDLEDPAAVWRRLGIQ